ncbi:hypothetical protein [Novosphingobium sp. Fuku2-ISO-50]|uniref:hypothetical protein n=1 Tax=Novosphingobium sp. Fuku2-ISO-50 TaxID=1739114 RepID=UPI0018D20762|nr:hypothetical protein [Novosphingobium sp. Fuku2-ISO-50]
MKVHVFFDNSVETIAHKFNAPPILGDHLEWSSSEFIVVKRAFIDSDGEMRLVIWVNSIDQAA